MGANAVHFTCGILSYYICAGTKYTVAILQQQKRPKLRRADGYFGKTAVKQKMYHFTMVYAKQRDKTIEPC